MFVETWFTINQAFGLVIVLCLPHRLKLFLSSPCFLEAHAKIEATNHAESFRPWLADKKIRLDTTCCFFFSQFSNKKIWAILNYCRSASKKIMFFKLYTYACCNNWYLSPRTCDTTFEKQNSCSDIP